MKLTKTKLKQIIKEELKSLLEAKEEWVIERSGRTFSEKFVVGGAAEDPDFGPLKKAKTFGSKESAKSFADKADLGLSVKNKSEFEN
tara:strand:- start:213 stop:473 length:261 start_codon:yes stop_codon:yes gene_type:complete